MSKYEIINVTEDDHQEIIEFFYNNFIPFEPINAAIGLCEKGYRFSKIKHVKLNVSEHFMF